MDTFEAALWFKKDNKADKKRAKEGLEEVFLRTGVLHAVTFKPIKFTTLEVGDNRLGGSTPPETMKDAACLVGEADVLGDLEMEKPVTDDIEEKSLKELRYITRKQYIMAGGPFLSDEECDQIINEHAPDIFYQEVLGSKKVEDVKDKTSDGK